MKNEIILSNIGILVGFLLAHFLYYLFGDGFALEDFISSLFYASFGLWFAYFSLREKPGVSLLKRAKHFISFWVKAVYTYLFKKPDYKIGQKCYAYGAICNGVFFDWEYGAWFIQSESILSFSYQIELFYKAEKEGA